MLSRSTIPLFVLLALVIPSSFMADATDREVVVFDGSAGLEWRVVNDGVMGGLSESRMIETPDRTALFEGRLSLENNGGFASVRAPLGPVDLSRFTGLSVRVRGDGRRYLLRLRTDDRFDGIAYQASFDADAGGWRTVDLPFSSFEPTFRGRTLPDAPRLDPGAIRQIGFMIADKKAGAFRLEIESVHAIAPGDRQD